MEVTIAVLKWISLLVILYFITTTAFSMTVYFCIWSFIVTPKILQWLHITKFWQWKVFVPWAIVTWAIFVLLILTIYSRADGPNLPSIDD